MTGPDPEILLDRIAALRGRIAYAEEQRAALVAERNRLFVEARNLVSPVTMVRLAEAAGISQPTVALVLRDAATLARTEAPR